MNTDEQTDVLLAQNATLALSLNWMRRQVEATRDQGYLPPGLLGETVLRDRQQEQIEEQAREISRLTERLEERDAPLHRALDEIAAERDALHANAIEIERLHLETLNSTSWRLTAPLRWVLRRLRGQSAPPFEPRYLLDSAPPDA